MKKKKTAVTKLEKNVISVRANTILLVILGLLALICVLPMILVVIVSFSSEQSIF